MANDYYGGGGGARGGGSGGGGSSKTTWIIAGVAALCICLSVSVFFSWQLGWLSWLQPQQQQQQQQGAAAGQDQQGQTGQTEQQDQQQAASDTQGGAYDAGTTTTESCTSGNWACPQGYEWVDATCSGGAKRDCWHPQLKKFEARVCLDAKPEDPSAFSLYDLRTLGTGTAFSLGSRTGSGSKVCPVGYTNRGGTCTHPQTGDTQPALAVEAALAPYNLGGSSLSYKQDLGQLMGSQDGCAIAQAQSGKLAASTGRSAVKLPRNAAPPSRGGGGKTVTKAAGASSKAKAPASASSSGRRVTAKGASASSAASSGGRQVSRR